MKRPRKIYLSWYEGKTARGGGEYLPCDDLKEAILMAGSGGTIYQATIMVSGKMKRGKFVPVKKK